MCASRKNARTARDARHALGLDRFALARLLATVGLNQAAADELQAALRAVRLTLSSPRTRGCATSLHALLEQLGSTGQRLVQDGMTARAIQLRRLLGKAPGPAARIQVALFHRQAQNGERAAAAKAWRCCAGPTSASAPAGSPTTASAWPASSWMPSCSWATTSRLAGLWSYTPRDSNGPWRAAVWPGAWHEGASRDWHASSYSRPSRRCSAGDNTIASWTS